MDYKKKYKKCKTRDELLEAFDEDVFMALFANRTIINEMETAMKEVAKRRRWDVSEALE